MRQPKANFIGKGHIPKCPKDTFSFAAGLLTRSHDHQQRDRDINFNQGKDRGIILKNTIRRSAAVLGFLILAAFCLHKIYNVLRWKDTTGGYLSAIDQLYHTEEGLMDLVFVGSSHCYYGIYPELLWEEKGIAAFDLAVSAQDKDSAYYQLKELLKTQHPSVVVVDIYAICHEKHMVESNIYRNYLSMRASLNSFLHIVSSSEEEKQKELLARWPIVHTRYRELKEFDFIPYEPSVIGRGSLITWALAAVDSENGVNLCETVQPLSEKNQEWVQRLIALSEEEGFELIFTLIPWKRDDERQAILNGFQEYSQEHDISFVNLAELTEEWNLCSATDWADPEHLNARGAEKLTRYLGEYLTAEYDFPDRRGDARYHQWDAAWDRYRQLEMLEQLKSIEDPAEYVSLLKDIPGITCILSLEGGYADSPTGIYPYVSGFHMDYQEYLLGGKWLYRNGELTKICENITGSEFFCDLNEIDSLKVCYEECFAEGNIQIDGIPYGNTWDGLQIVIYDDIEKKVILTREIH